MSSRPSAIGSETAPTLTASSASCRPRDELPRSKPADHRQPDPHRKQPIKSGETIDDRALQPLGTLGRWLTHPFTARTARSAASCSGATL